MNIRDLYAIAARIRFAVFDVDGVFTDGRLYYTAEGETMKVFNVRDGFGIKALQDAGIEIGIITGRNSPVVNTRMEELGIRHIIRNRSDKGAALQELLDKTGYKATETAYMGDDLPDVAALEMVAFPATVQDAEQSVIRTAVWRSGAAGGRGAVREFADMLLKARSKSGEASGQKSDKK